jgi:2-hydroxychromene-2-carboxylate isomerase
MSISGRGRRWTAVGGMREDVPVESSAPRFYFAAMSPYSWLAAERIGQLLPEARWIPVTAAFIFKAAGRTSWGLTEHRAEGMADTEARAGKHGLGPVAWPDPWPTNDVPIARAMTFADERGELQRYALAAMRLAFLEGWDLARQETILEAGTRSGIPPAEIEAALGEQEIKLALRQATDGASTEGVFGVPTVIVDGQLFWGDDRLAEAAAAYRATRAG